MSYERIRHVHKLSYGRSGDGGVLTKLMLKVDEIDVFLDIVICISLIGPKFVCRKVYPSFEQFRHEFLMNLYEHL